jgi:hypothetical protein
MKKSIGFVLVFLIICLGCFPFEAGYETGSLHFIKIGVGAHFKSVGEPLYKDLYGSGNLMFSGSAGIVIFRFLELRGEVARFQDKGVMSITQEELKFSITSIGGGLRFQLPLKKISPYLGVGYVNYSFQEKYPERFESVSDSEGGISWETGVYLPITKLFQIDFNFRYTKLSSEDAFEEEVALGGLQAGIAIELRF